MNEVVSLFLVGEFIEYIDKVLFNFGFLVGLVKLLDEVGIDVGIKIIFIFIDVFGECFIVLLVFDKVLVDECKGKKNKKGFYDYSGKKLGKVVDESIYLLLGVLLLKSCSELEILECCVLMMFNEVVCCLDEGVICSVRDGDIGVIFGIGFLLFFGGFFCYMDQLGVVKVVECLNYYVDKVDVKFKLVVVLEIMIVENIIFY